MANSDSNFYDKDSNFLERSDLRTNLSASKKIIKDGQSILNRPFLDEVIDQCIDNLHYRNALIVINNLITVFPFDCSLWHKKALCYRKMHLNKKAFRSFQKALQLDPVNFDILLDFASFYMMNKHQKRATEIIEQLKTLYPANSELFYKIGEIYQEKSDYQTAIQYYLRFMQDIPESRDGLFQLAVCFEYQKDYQTSLEYYDRYLFIEAHCEIGWYNRGIVLENLKKHFEAIESYQFSLSLNDKFVDSWFNLGNMHADLDNYNQAIDCFKHVINLQSTNAEAYFNLGVLYEDLFDYQQSIYFYSKALQLDLSFQEAYLGRGYCYLKTDNIAYALNDFRCSLTYNTSQMTDWALPKSKNISIDENCIKKIRDYENHESTARTEADILDIIQNYINIGKYNEAMNLLIASAKSSLTANDFFLLAKIHFCKNNNYLGYLYLNKSFYINSELIEIFSKMFPVITSSKLFNSLLEIKK